MSDDHARDLQTIGRLIARRRHELHLTQTQLGDRAGASQFQVSEWELGKRDLRVSTLLRLARAMKLELRIEPARG